MLGPVYISSLLVYVFNEELGTLMLDLWKDTV
ncbi:hypothetical protein T11_10418 [Trichinella zimbabwensis]|uniref:Uncharacterized protein n=1 Tax=Trichinella zimbabwensis TaxID=268475 RepID=A0A0V1GJV3_9BILA|nr:hypothetical protein T11_10418 [Trichinella zimbabwensis]